jgi:peptidoglycan L-alanyl-D-glutamate endopeptidase CwlK
MQDQITLDRIKLLHPIDRESAFRCYEEICTALPSNVICRYPYTIRTFAEQDGLWEIGRTKPGKIVTNAKGGYSYHNYGLAKDIVFLLDKDKNGSYESPSWDFGADFDGDGTIDWKEVDAIMKKYGYVGLYNKKKQRWDLPHFQKTHGKTIHELLALYDAKKVDKNNYVIL